MARKAILDTYYSFNVVSKTITIPRAIPQERLVLITDVTNNIVIYNFSDPNLKSTAYSIATSADGSNTSTTVVLNYNTSALANTDKLQIVVDEYDEKFTPAETMLDPINKLRTSTPQSLIDTDYEYSIQTTKWEQLAMLNNRPYAYYVTATGNLGLTDVQAVLGSRIYTANVTSAPLPAVGTPVYIQDTIYGGADGLYIVNSNNNVAGANTFTYAGRYYFTGATGSIFNTGVTQGYYGNTFTNAAIAMTSASVTGNTVTVVTAAPHGLTVGNEIALTGASTANGSWLVSTIQSPNTFNFYTDTFTPTSGAVTLTSASLYVRPQGSAVHRAFDGGVRFSTNASSHNHQYIRQTRRYFRYQSGKGIQMSTGTTLKSQFNLDGLIYTSANNQVQVTTKDPHNIFATMGVAINGANETGYNGIFNVLNVIDPYRFTYTPNTAPTATVASGNYVGSAYSWYNGTNRIGIFDSQNGLFYEFDGQTLWAVRRSSTYQISGQAVVVPGSNIVNSSTLYPTSFSKQVTAGDFIVIKGMSYRVVNIMSDQQMMINPAYRGTIQSNNAVISKTVDTRITQNQFNIDRLDGTGPSGYNIDLTKMQMMYIDYSWYGAGFIRFGVRGPDGNVIYCHKIINNNVNYLAYMRSGNLPGRYETNTFSKTTYLLGGQSGPGTALNSTDTLIYAANTFGFPNSGTLVLKNANTGGLSYANTEFVNYSGISGNTFTGLTRGQVGNTTGIVVNTIAGNNLIQLTTGQVTTGLQVGQLVFGGAGAANVAAGSYIAGINQVGSNTITLNTGALATNTGVVIYVQPMANTGQTFLYTATAQTSIELHAPQFSPEINHWGTSAIMDGGFTVDKSFIFTKGMTSNVIVAAGASQAVMSFRISPSASGGVPGGTLGVREVINRMQQIPYEADVYANGAFLITCYLNAKTSNTAEVWQNVGGSSLSQYIFHNTGTTANTNTGEPVFGFFLNINPGAGSTTQQDLSQLLALGHSILGGGATTGGSGIYPDGPDVLTFVAQNIDTAARSIQARYSWNEAQA
jgi:hypothetical protein